METRCDAVAPVELAAGTRRCVRAIGHSGEHGTSITSAAALVWPNDDPVPDVVIEAAKAVWKVRRGGTSGPDGPSGAVESYWLRFGSAFRVPMIHASTCGWYGGGSGTYFTVGQLADLDPRGRARDCRLCGGMWAGFDADAYRG